MPYYKNKLNRKLTVFINNAVPVKFMDGETKKLTCDDLHLVYPRFIELIDESQLLVNKIKKEEKIEKEETKEFISEVKQPVAEKELVSEPVEEEVKAKPKAKAKPKSKGKAKPKAKAKKKTKISEGYNQFAKETVVAKSEVSKKSEE